MTRPDPVLITVPERIDTERLVLAAPRPGLGQALNAAVADSVERLKLWMPWAQTVPSVEESEAVLRKMQADFILRRELNFQIYQRNADGSAGRLIGGSGLHSLNWELRRYEIGYWIRSGCEGQGYVSEAVRAIAAMAFEQLNARRVEIRCDAHNTRSRAVAERCGFELEGVLRRDSLTPQGEPRDTCVYSRIAGASGTTA